MCHPPCLDLCGISGGVMQSVTAVDSGNQQKLRSRRKGKDRNPLGRISKCSGEMIHAISLFRQRLNARRTMNDNDKPRSFALFCRTKISCFDPLLTSVGTPYAPEPFLAFFHPPIELAAC